MPKLHIIYDPKDMIAQPPNDLYERTGIKVAVISVCDMDKEDIYTLARKLAEMLLEQL